MFINQDITNQITSILDGLKYEQYTKQTRMKVEQIIKEILFSVSDQYDLSKLIIKVNYYYEDKCLNIIIDLNDQHIETNVFLIKKEI